MSKCELPNSVSIGSKLDQENQENGPNVARGATFSDVDRGWAFVVLLSSSVCMFVGATLSYGTGVVHVALLEKFKKDAAFTSLIGSIFFSLLSLMGPAVSFVVNRWSCRVGTILGGFLVFTGFTSSFFVTENLTVLLLTYSCIAGSGMGFICLAPIIASGYSFEKYRGTAVGFTVMGAGFGIFGSGPLTQFLLDTYGLNGTFLIFGGLGLQCVLAGALMRPSQLELKQKINLQMAKRTKHGIENSRCKMYSDLCRNKTFIMIVICGFLWNAAYAIVSVNLSNYVYSLGTNKQDAAFLWTMVGIGSTVNRLLAGLTLGPNGIDPLLLQFGFLGIVGVLGLTFPFYASIFIGQCLFSLMYGIYSGGLVVLTNPLCLELVGLQQLPLAVGFMYFIAGFGSISGPPITGLIVEALDDYSVAFYLAGGLFLLAGIFALMSTFWRSENAFVPAASILSLNSARFLSGSAIFSGSLTFIVDPKNIVNAECVSLYSLQSMTRKNFDTSTDNVAKILLARKFQSRDRTQSENDVHFANNVKYSPIVFKKRTSSVEMNGNKLAKIENGKT